ncbi:hypothetical protein ACSBR2_004424 [Camellia fascicularis]
MGYRKKKNPKAPAAAAKNELEEEEEEEFWALSDKPNFSMLLTKTHVRPLCRLFVPTNMHRVLPCIAVPVILTYRGNNWEMIYFGDHISKRFDTRWARFVNDNDLRIGDACVFEVVECSNRLVRFRVQILRGDFPPELLARVHNGQTSDAAIVIE